MFRILCALLIALVGWGCACGDEADGNGSGTKTPSGPPPRITTNPPCVISADCPAGQHCDLGECIQECNLEDACEAGDTCSGRARCLAPGEEDKDPEPVTERIGTIAVEPTSLRLTDRDTSVTVRLTSDATSPVRYRVQLVAPHLSIAEPRGQFEGTTDLTFQVNTANLQGKDVPGTIRIFTTLGNVVIDAPIKVGLTGTYQGALVYDGTDIPLGSSQIVLDLVERNGDVTVQIDAERSLLFPASSSGSVAGRGLFTFSSGVEFSLKQVIAADFGGAANHFGRELGRELSVRLQPSDRGTLQGTFEERVHGLLPQPVVLSGTVYLEHRTLQREDIAIDVPPDPMMPVVTATGAPDVAQAFPGWTETSCGLDAIAAAGSCMGLIPCAEFLDQHYHAPLELKLTGVLPAGPDPLGGIAELCAWDLVRSEPVAPVECALIPPLACAIKAISSDPSPPTSQEATDAFSRLFAHTLDPALLVAQDKVVKGVEESFVQGIHTQKTYLEQARATLVGPASWVLHPSVLGYFARIPQMTPPAPGPSGEPSHYQALRTLARLFYVHSTIDGELSRISAADRVAPQADRIRAAQERGLLTLFEAAVVEGVLASWAESAPPGVGTEFIDVLTPMDQGFSSLQQGALQFGVPEGFIPFVDDTSGVETTNVERMFSSIQSRLETQSADETSFVNATREFEQNAAALAQEFESVRVNLDGQIADDCGADFDVAAITSDADWEACGQNGGNVQALKVGILQAQARLLAAQNRIMGMGEKIQIEQSRLNQVREVREGTIRFIEDTGEQLQSIIFAEGIINAVQKMLDISSNSQVLNFGTPAAMGAAAAYFETQRTLLASERQRLQTAQEIRIQADNAQVEVINGMAVIKGMMVDMAQLQVEMRQDLLGQLQAEIDVRNAVERVKRLASERSKVFARIQSSPHTDPTFRLLQSRAALRAIRSRADAQRALFLAGRALEYHLNRPFENSLSQAVLNAYNATEIGNLRRCLNTILEDSKLELGAPQDYSTEFSVRKLLGIIGPRVDEVTGEELSEGEQFRRILLRNENLDGTGGVGIEFSSNLEPGNQLWASNVCDDKITSVEAQIVGDFLGDNDARVELFLEGGGVLRRCDRQELINWSTSGGASIQAGVNTFGTAPTPNGSLRGLSVASALWRVVLPGASAAPPNSDLDLEQVEDIVLRVRHEARPIRSAPVEVSLTCLANIGAGG